MFLHKMKDHWLYKIIDVIDFKYKNMHTLVTHDGTVIIRSKSWNWNDEKNIIKFLKIQFTPKYADENLEHEHYKKQHRQLIFISIHLPT